MTTNSQPMAFHQKIKQIYYVKKRYFVYGFFTVFSLVMPWIRINGNHIFLLSFDKMQLHLMGVSFDMQEFYLMPFLVMLLFLFIFFITVLGGRVWCGWACPQTIFRVIYRDLIQGVLLGLRKRNNKQKVLTGHYFKRTLGFIIWSVLAFIAASDFSWYFIPPEDYFVYMQEPFSHPVLLGFLSIITLFLIYDIVKLKEDFCGYICPYVRIQSALYDHDTIYTIYDEGRGGKIYEDKKKLWKKPPEGECIGCEACVTVCPTHIDIRKGMQFECINCLECADACTGVMGRLGKKSLVNWESNRSYVDKQPTRFFRFKIKGYLVIMSAVLVALFFMGAEKENMLLNINKENKIYKYSEGVVTNSYIFLFVNTDKKAHKYYFDVMADGIKIRQPSQAFVVKPGQKLKKIVVLEATKTLGTKKTNYTKIPLKIVAYAVDDKEKISVKRDTVFVYPPLDELKR
ncbi:MAG: cytochrome c oxidase accessory protein CcoG [Helicobacteraceae bacterium]